MKRILIACAALLLVMSCSHDSSPTAPAAINGKATITVVDSATNAGIAGVTIEVRREKDGPVITSTTTNASGVAEIAFSSAVWLRVLPPAGYANDADTLLQAGTVVALRVTLTKQ
jgi:hypothetical protein